MSSYRCSLLLCRGVAIALALLIGAVGSIHAQQYAFERAVPAEADERYNEPRDVALSMADSTLYVADQDEELIFRYRLDGTRRAPLRSVYADGRSHELSEPVGLEMGPDGTLFIADVDSERIFAIRDDSTASTILGRGGGNLGEFDDLFDVTAATDGYAYALDLGIPHLPFFDADGQYISWIRGGNKNVEDPLAVGMNSANELYVLEEGPSVTILDEQGAPVTRFDALNQRSGVSIDTPSDLAVLPGGDFLILDQEKGRITHFSRSGSVIGNFGAKGEGGAGTFQEPIRLSVDRTTGNRVAVLDAEGENAQVFQVPARPDTLTAPSRPLGLQKSASSPKPFVDLVRHPDGRLYYIPEEDRSKVIGTTGTGSSQTIQVDEARALAIGPNETLFVVDEGAESIRQYDSEGALIREFGQQLDTPTDVAALPSEHVLVADEGEGAIQAWNTDGVYQTRLPVSGILDEPMQVASRDSSRIYVWDPGREQLLRTGYSTQYKDSVSTLRLRTEDVGARDGEMMGVEVDPLDRVHTFNLATHQYEVFSWTEEPTSLFRFGREGEGPFSFEDVEGFSFDDQNFTAHVRTDGGDAVTSVQLSVRPPAPADSFQFRNAADTLLASVAAIENPAVTGYGLLRLHPGTQPDTVATGDTSTLPVPPQSTDSLTAPARYAFVSTSPTSTSAPTASFTDYFGYAGQLFNRGRHDAALDAYRTAQDSLRLSDETDRFIAQRYATLGRSLAASYNLSDALRYLRAGQSLAPDDTTGAQALGFGYRQQLRKLANEERYDSLRTAATTVLDNSPPPPVREAIVSAVDSIASTLRDRPSVSARSDAVSLYESLRTWADSTARSSYALADAYWGAYDAMQEAGASALKQDLALENAQSAAKTAVDRVASDASFYHDAHLLLVDVFLAQSKPQKAVTVASRELQNKAAPLDTGDETAYRERLGTAYQRDGEYASAIREYQKLLSDHPDRGKYKLALADVLVDEGSYARAKTLYEELRAKRPDDPQLLARIGSLELERGNFSEASLQLKKALDQNPDLSGVRGKLAEAYDGASTYQKAIETYKAAVKETRRRLDTTQTGDSAPREVQRTTDRLSSHLQSLGRLYRQLGQYSNAISVYQDLTTLASSNVKAWHGLGKAYLKSGRVYQALSALNRALKLDETNQTISEDLSRARSLRDKVSENRAPIEVIETNVDALYPSLYKNYSDPSKLPIGTIALANNTSLPKSNATLTFYIEGLMDEPTEQKMKPLGSYTNTTIPLHAVFSESILEVTEERTVQGRLTLSYRHDGEKKTVEKTVPITVHGRNAIKWEDKRRLAAFIPTRDSDLIDYVKSVDRLFQETSDYGLPKNVVKGLRIYTVLKADEYTYSVDPKTDFSVVSRNPEMLDYCQYPEETMQRKAGDCDDLVSLYLSVLANAGITTAYIDIPGHVMSAFDTGLSPKDLSGSGLSREEVIVQNETVWLPVETTLLGSEPFLTAWTKGIERYRTEQEEGDLPQVISMADARSVYEPSSIQPESSAATSLPSDTSSILSAYNEQITSLYARTTESRRRQLREQLQSDPKNTVVRNRLSILLVRAGQRQEAERLYEKGLEHTPTSSLLLNNYANVLYKQERYKKAIELYERSLSKGTEDPEVYMNLCKAQLALGRTRAASSSFETAIQKDPSLQEPYSYLQEQL